VISDEELVKEGSTETQGTSASLAPLLLEAVTIDKGAAPLLLDAWTNSEL
jgi:hypothetical protein